MSVGVRVPASTSNLGSGFDCVGVAIDRWLRVTARVAASVTTPPVIERHGTLRSLAVSAERDLLWVGFTAACRAAGRPVPAGVVLHAASDIPVGRGLGSSAAAVVAGAAAASALLALALDDDHLLALAASVEGHPDNAAAAVRGGAVLAVPRPDGDYVVVDLDVHPSLALVFAVPDFAVETERARAVLPELLPHGTARVAAARAAALVAGLGRGDRTLLAAGLADVLHTPFRCALVPGYAVVTTAAVTAGAMGATLSGSGSSIVAVAPAEQAAAVGQAMAAAWHRSGVTAEWFSCRRPTAGYQVVQRARYREIPSSLEA